MRRIVPCLHLLVLAALSALLGACAVTGVETHEPAMSGAGSGEPSERQSMLFLTTSGTDAPHRAVLTFDFAVIAREKGHDVYVFLAGDATLLMKENVRVAIRAPGQPGAAELVARARDLGIPVYV